MLPLAHVSSDKKGIALINPWAVNLDAYKEKLEQAIKSYERQVYSPGTYYGCCHVSVFSSILGISSHMLCSIMIILYVDTL